MPSGNAAQSLAYVPVNVCGNTANVIGVANAGLRQQLLLVVEYAPSQHCLPCLQDPQPSSVVSKGHRSL